MLRSLKNTNRRRARANTRGRNPLRPDCPGARRFEAGGDDDPAGRTGLDLPSQTDRDEGLCSRDGPTARRVRQRLAEMLGCCDQPDCCDPVRPHRDVLGGERQCYCGPSDGPDAPCGLPPPPPRRCVRQAARGRAIVDRADAEPRDRERPERQRQPGQRCRARPRAVPARNGDRSHGRDDDAPLRDEVQCLGEELREQRRRLEALERTLEKSPGS